MTRAELETLIFDRYGIRADYPFEDDLVTGVFRHTGSGRWFAIAMSIPVSKLGLPTDGRADVANFKCAPEVIESLVGEEPGVFRAYHMNKAHWLTVLLSACSPDTVAWLLGISFELTEGKMICKSKRKGKE